MSYLEDGCDIDKEDVVFKDVEEMPKEKKTKGKSPKMEKCPL